MTYLEYLPSVKHILISCIPTVCYFVSCSFYELFIEKPKLNMKDYYTNSSKNMVLSSITNIFLVYPLFIYFDKTLDTVSPMCIIGGCLMVDTIEYMWHYLLHYKFSLYNKFHHIHHKATPIHPRTSFYNSDYEVFMTSATLLLSFLVLPYSYYDYIVITSLSYVSTVCDHTNTSKNKFHILHHNNNKNKNLQQPFFTFWDHIFGTYNKNSELKIPFVPN